MLFENLLLFIPVSITVLMINLLKFALIKDILLKKVSNIGQVDKYTDDI